MKHFKKNYSISFFILAIFSSLFFVAHYSFAQSEEPLYITAVEQFELYPFQASSGQNYGLQGSSNPVGICALINTYAGIQTNLAMQAVPYSNPNSSWVSVGAPQYPLSQGWNGLNIVLGNSVSSNLLPSTAYTFRLLEVGNSGNSYFITPEDTGDDVKTMCTPNANGSLNQSCGFGSIVVSECSPAGVNQAIQNASNGGTFYGPSATIGNITSTSNSLNFSVNLSGATPGIPIAVGYTTNSSAIPDGNASLISVIEYPVSGQGSATIPVSLTNLQANTNYFVTVYYGVNQAIIINTPNGQPFYTLQTVNTGQTSTSQTTANININLSGEFGQAELAGENINQGLVQCGYGETYDCDFNQVLATIDRIIKFLLYIIALPVAAILFAYSGIKLIIAKASGKQAALGEAKSVIFNVLIGLIFAMGAWVIVKFVLVILGYTDASGIITQILGITTTQ